MPKEITYSDEEMYFKKDGEEFDHRKAEQGSGETFYRRGVHIGWNKNLYVEVGVAEYEVGTESINESGMFTSLDREGINRLIRTLRTARDQAFGKDA